MRTYQFYLGNVWIQNFDELTCLVNEIGAYVDRRIESVSK